ncbi:MAG: FAD-dependent oxidoreductase [Anaerotruncus massiliensis (ex Togo et al. 2019)]
MTVKNRLVMTAMCVGLAHHDGAVSDALAAYYEERAAGGVGLMITECTRVNETDAVAYPSMLSMSHDRYIEPLRKAAERVHAHGAKLFMQLYHPGRQNVVLFPTIWRFNERMARIFPSYWDWYFKMAGRFDASMIDDPKTAKRMEKYMKPLLAPSDVPCGLGDNPVRHQKTVPMTIPQIKTLIGQFIAAAGRVKKAGADGVELHAAHGYLLQQFLSPYTNRREDDYGGSLENRMRLLKEIIECVKAECGPDFPISVRLSVEEFYDTIGYPGQGILWRRAWRWQSGWNASASMRSTSAAATTTRRRLPASPSVSPGWRKYLAKAVKEQVRIPVIAANLIRTPEQAEAQLNEGTQDFIAMGRSYLSDPEWAKKAMEGRSGEINRCICCLRCMESFQENIMNGKPVECAVNPRACRESKFPRTAPKDGWQRPVVVVGAGPAGLTAANELAARDFKVTVLEQGGAPGGQLILAAAPPLKEKMDWFIQYLTHQALQQGVDIRYNTRAAKEVIESFRPYAVFLATGAEAAAPRIPGSDSDTVTTVTPILTGERTYAGKEVAVIGSGMTGLKRRSLMGRGTPLPSSRWRIRSPPALTHQRLDVIGRLEKGGVRFLPGRRLERIGDGMLYLEAQGRRAGRNPGRRHSAGHRCA